jgi:glc operon protein GlcG
MSRHSFAPHFALVLSVLLVAQANAQSLLTEKHAITGYAARRIIDACTATAVREHFPIALAVVDPAGNLVSFQSPGGAMGHTGLTALMKAKTAAIFRRSTGELYERVNKQINRAPEWMGYFPIPGGFPVVVSGEVVGGVGAGSAGLSGGRDENCVQSATAQVMGDGKGRPPPSPEPLLVAYHSLTPAAARKLVDACVSFADQKGFKALGMSVVDPDANLLSSQGTQGATATALKTAELKAITAAHWRRTTAELWERVNKQVNRAPEWLGDFAQPGGFPIFVDGEMVGAMGAGGAVGNQDDQCAEAAIKAVFPNATMTAEGR